MIAEADEPCLHRQIKAVVERFGAEWGSRKGDQLPLMLEAFAELIAEHTAGYDQATRRQVSVDLMKAIVRNENDLKEEKAA